MNLKTVPALIFLALALPAPLFATARAEGPPAATIVVTQVRAQTGVIRAALYDERGWARANGADRADALAVAVAAVEGASVTLRLAAPGPGRYAVRLYHDVDGDGALARNFIGMPSEPVGFSNNAPLAFGPPAFAAAAFDLPESGAQQTIALR